MLGQVKQQLSGATRRALGHSDARGVTTVELALVLPIILIFIMGIIELGNIYRVMLTMQKASQFGTRMAVTGMGFEDGSRMNFILDATNRLLADLPAPPAVVTVTSWPGVDSSGTGREGNPGLPCELVEVRVDYEYHTITPLSGLLSLFGGFFREKIPMTQSAMKVNEPWIPCK